MSGSPGALGPARIRAVSLALVVATAAIAQTAGCSRSDRRQLPTEPVEQTEGASRAAETPVGRMPIARVPRQTPPPRVTASPAPVTASPTGTATAPIATPTPSVTAALSPSTTTPTPSVTPTLSPSTATPTQTSTPTATPTRTATPAATIVIGLRGISWQWDFYGPGAAGSSIELKVGQPYEIHIFNNGPPDASSHTFSGNADLGLSGAVLDPGAPAVVQTFTPQRTGAYPFLCTDSSCGTGHGNMTGSIQVR